MNSEKESLQTALQKLEKIVDKLSQNDADIETNLKNFKEGAALVKFCKDELKSLENEFHKIKAEMEEKNSNDFQR